MTFVVVVVAVGILNGIVFLTVASTPAIAEGVAETWYH
jgi:hypothetical protein